MALALARARAAPARWALASLGIAVAVALLGSAVGGGAVAGERAAADAVEHLPPAQRSVRVGWSGGVPAAVERRARRALAALTPAAQTTSVLLLPTVVEERRGAGAAPVRRVVQLAAVAPLSRWVRLRSGRLPRACTARRCEVLAVGGPAVPPVLDRNGTRIVTVGRGVLTSPVPLGFVPGPAVAGRLAAGRQRALLVGADPRGADTAGGFATVFRSHGWSAPLDTTGRPSWRLDALRLRIERTANALTATDASYSLQAPTAALATARARAAEARRRVTLVGAGAAALLAAFVVLAAGALRRDLAAERSRLERRGARRWQLTVLDVAECGGPALVGVAAGAAAAVAVTALRARAAGVDAGAVIGHTLLAPSAFAAAVLCWVPATVLLGLGARTWGPQAGRLVDVAALGAAAALAVALARGGVGAGARGDPLPALLPPLACLTAGLLVARLAGPVLRGLEVAGRRGPLALRLAGLGVARKPGTPAVAVAVVAVSLGLACFAAAYAATLRQAERDQAADRVPLEVIVREGAAFVPPLAVADLDRWRALTGGGPVLPVQRTSAAVPRGAFQASLPLVALPAAGLGALRGWREEDASAPRAVLARRLAPPAGLGSRGPAIPAGARTLTVRARTEGDALDLTAHLLAADGSALPLDLGTTGPRARTLRVVLPPPAAGRRLVALEATPASGLRATDGHQEAESPASRAVVVGRLTLDEVAIGDRRVDVAGWIGRGSLASPRPDGAAVRADYAFDPPDRALLRPRQPLDGAAIPVLTDPATAAGAGRGGLLPLDVGGVALRARVVGVVDRFPTVGAGAGGFVVADEATLRAARSADAPGTARPDELWLGAGPRTSQRALLRAVRGRPLSVLDVASRQELEQRLRRDPLARELARTLVLAAAAALALAAIGLALMTATTLRDDRAELTDLEALGVPPGTLRAEVRVRAALVAALGMAAGLAIGAALLALVVDAVQLTAAGTGPVPPIIAVVPWPTWAAAAAAFAAGVAVAVGVLTRRSSTGSRA